MNRVSELFGIQYPIIQGGMIWASGWRLASAVSNAGGLGLLGAGSMDKEVLIEHIRKCRNATEKPFGVNIPIMYKHSQELIQTVIEEKVPIVFTSAGNPALYTKTLQSHGIKVAHVVSSAYFALKAQNAGVDAVVAEGFEAGGHNGREETTTFTLIPLVRQHINIPLIAAGGIGTGAALYAALSLGAEGVQMGSRFVATYEAGVHPAFKEMVVNAQEGDTLLTLKELAPVRLLKNDFFEQLQDLYKSGEASPEKLKELLGYGRTKKGMFLGDLQEGELEIGQVSALIDKIQSVQEVFEQLLSEYQQTQERMQSQNLRLI